MSVKKSTIRKKPSAKVARPRNVLAFIDTNIFLDFYRRSNEANLSLLEKLKGVRDRVLSTYQVEMEFLKNRQKTLLQELNSFSFDVPTNIPAVVSDSNFLKELKKIKNELESKKKELEKRVTKTLKNPKANDRVFQVLDDIFKSNAGHVLTRDMEQRKVIKGRAFKRFSLGYPPRKANDTSFGDALNWEWIIHCAKESKGNKIYIVSRDNDFGYKLGDHCYLNDQLKAECLDRVGSESVIFSNKLSEALAELNVSVSVEEQQAEDAALASSVFPALAAVPMYPPLSGIPLNPNPISDLSILEKSIYTVPQLNQVQSDLRKAVIEIEDFREMLREVISIPKLGKDDID